MSQTEDEKLSPTFYSPFTEPTSYRIPEPRKQVARWTEWTGDVFEVADPAPASVAETQE